MTPEFAKAIDPIFMRVLGLLERIERGEALSAEDERAAIRGYLGQAEGHLGKKPDWQLAKYALVSWIDEVLIEAPWESRKWWVDYTLEWEEFKTAECSEQFYIKADDAQKLPDKDALEVFYVCVVLGFRGLYRDAQQAVALAEPLGLPAELETWARRTSLAIRLGEGRPRISEAGQPLVGAAPLEGPFLLLCSLFFGIILAAVAGVLAWMCFSPS